MKKVPNPGSDKAIDGGCTCPVLDNEHGRGYYGDGKTFVYRMDCPMHGKTLEAKKDTHEDREDAPRS